MKRSKKPKPYPQVRELLEATDEICQDYKAKHPEKAKPKKIK